MTLDFATLTFAGALVALICGLLLVAAWTQYGDSLVAFSLGGSHMIGASAIALLAFGGVHGAVLVEFAQPAFLLAAFLALFSALSFDRRSITNAFVIAAVAAAGLAAWWSSKHLDPGLVRIVQLAIVTPTFTVAGVMLWLRRDGLKARLPLAAVFMLHGAVNAIGLAEAVLKDALASGIASFSNWYGVVHVESMIYFIGSTLFMVALLKERSESGYRSASLTDILTGLPNRRAFFIACERMLSRRRRSSPPMVVLAVDLDRFKGVNDTFGHAVGDQVLKVFASVARASLRPDDIVGRLGGEEFAVLLPRTTASEGHEVAERLRSAFEQAASNVGEHEVHATLSIGAALLVGAEASISQTLEEADTALYRAKMNGRNRVEFGPAERKFRLVV